MKYKTVQEALDNFPKLDNVDTTLGAYILRRDELDQWEFDFEEVKNANRSLYRPQVQREFRDPTFTYGD
jgi:hypothetical protein